MKQLFRILAFFAGAMLIFAYTAIGQTPELPPIENVTADNIFTQLMDPVYTGLVLVFGYVSYLIPGFGKVKPFIRVLAFALVAGLGFVLFGGNFWKIAFSYFVATGLYDLFLKKIFPSPSGRTGAKASAS